jgi:uncharacterized damage-inducible protein DinB
VFVSGNAVIVFGSLTAISFRMPCIGHNGTDMAEVVRIGDQLKRAFEGDCWWGPGVREVLKGITEEQALRRREGLHSICELVRHMTVWKQAVADGLAGKPIAVSEEQDFPAAGAWQAALDGLEAAQRSLMTALATLDDSRLSQLMPGRDYTVYFALHGVIQHDVYHAGQIMALKRTGQ